MLQTAKSIAKDLHLNKSDLMVGFHAKSSLKPLHLHVITKDFNSPHLKVTILILTTKSKRNYLSFHTDYFIKIDQVLKSLKEYKKFHHPLSEAELNELTKRSLTCHICGKVFNTIPQLKNDLLKHEIMKSAVKLSPSKSLFHCDQCILFYYYRWRYT